MKHLKNILALTLVLALMGGMVPAWSEEEATLENEQVFEAVEEIELELGEPVEPEAADGPMVETPDVLPFDEEEKPAIEDGDGAISETEGEEADTSIVPEEDIPEAMELVMDAAEGVETEETVTEAVGDRIVLEPESLLLGAGESGTLSARFEYDEIPETEDSVPAVPAMVFESSDTKIVTVTAKGAVKGVKKGEAVITVRTEDGLVSAECPVTVAGAPTSIKLNASKSTLSYDAASGMGTTFQLNATLSSGSASKITYKSSNKKVARVDADGVINATGAGIAYITASTYNNRSATCVVTVKAAPKSVSLSSHALSLSEGMSAKLSAKLPKNTAASLTYSADDPNVVDVDATTGALTAIYEGETTVRVRTNNDVEDACVVTVLPAPTGIELTGGASGGVLGVGETIQLSAMAVREDGRETAATISYTSSNTAAATVDQKGKVTAKKAAGEPVVITAATHNGIAATVELTIVKAPTSIKLNASRVSLGYDKATDMGTTFQIMPTLSAGSASVITYKSTNAKVASVDGDGLVTAKGAGTAYITAMTFNRRSAMLVVTVKAAPQSITLSPASVTLAEGDGKALTATLPKNTASSLTWTSDDPAVAEVDGSGRLIAVAEGETTVRVRAFNGVEAETTVRVLPGPTGIELTTKCAGALGVGETTQITAVPVRDDGRDTIASITFKSSNAKVATVDAKGKVTAKTASTEPVVITAMAGNGVSAEITITVGKVPTSLKLNTSKVSLGYDKQTGEGTTYQLAPTLSAGSVSTITYKSNKKSVAKVDENGLITATGEGTAVITASTYNYRSATVTVAVKAAPDSVSLSPAAITIGMGDSGKVTGAIPKNTASTLTYASDDEFVATVDAAGRVYGAGVGETVIRVHTYNGHEAESVVRVLPEPEALDMTLCDGCRLGVGETLKLTALPVLADGTQTAATITWKSSDAKIATVSANGKVTAKKIGKCVVTATAYNGVSASREIEVFKAPLTIKLSPAKLTMGYDAATGTGETRTLAVTLTSGSESHIKFSGYDKSVISVDDEGNVTALAPGKTTITATTFNKRTAKCTVTVKAAPDSVTLPKEAVTIGAGASVSLTATIPANTYSVITYTSSDPDIVSVNASGKVTCVQEGEATITASTWNGHAAQCVVTVVPAPTNLEVKPGKITIAVGEKGVEVEPSVDVGELYGGYTFKSGNVYIAKVSGSGVVTGVRAGSTTIKVSTYNGLTVSVPVTVGNKPTKVTLSPASLVMGVGESAALKATFPAYQASTLIYESSDSEVAQVDEAGRVTATGLGEAKITVTTCNGKTASCKVQVVVPAATIELPEAVTVSVYESEPLIYQVLDENGDVYAGPITATLSPTGYCDYKDGAVKGKKAGSATLTVKAGALTATCAITVLSYKAAHTVQSIAHRGGCAYWPENTLEAFRNVASTGAEAVELDARTTKDGVEIIHHDATFTVGGVKYTIANLTVAQIKQLKPSVCTLDEALDVLDAAGLGIHLELKETADGAKCVEAIRRHGLENRTVYFSFFEPQLKQVYAADPTVTLGLSLKADAQPKSTTLMKRVKDLHISFLVANRKLMTQDVTNYWHEKGLKICVWTVNNRDEVKKLVNMGVDYILSDHPDYCVDAR